MYIDVGVHTHVACIISAPRKGRQRGSSVNPPADILLHLIGHK